MSSSKLFDHSKDLNQQLLEIRNQLVALSKEHHTSMQTIFEMKIVFTGGETASSTSSSGNYGNGSPNVPSPKHGAAFTSVATPTDVSQATTRFVPTVPEEDRAAAGRGRTGQTNGVVIGNSPPPRPQTAIASSTHQQLQNTTATSSQRTEHVTPPPSLAKTSVTSPAQPAAATGGEGTAKKNFSSSNPLFDVLPEGYAFGIEMETILAKRSEELLMDCRIKAIRDVIPNLSTLMGEKDCKFVFFDYDSAKADRKYECWKITTDLSIKPEDGRPIFGLEFVSPKLQGPGGLAEAEMVCRALTKCGFATNSTTALHIHVGCENLSDDELRRVCQYLVVFENVIDEFMTVPRRADYSRYCRSNLKSITITRSTEEAVGILEKLDISPGVNSLVKCMNPKLSNIKNSHRNHKVNLSLLTNTRKNTRGRRLEFRQHQGSCDAEEVTSWVQLVVRMVDKFRKLPHPPGNGARGTAEQFWKIIDNAQLHKIYDIRKEALPKDVHFIYDSRELFQGEGGDDSDDELDEAAYSTMVPNVAALTSGSTLSGPQGGAVMGSLMGSFSEVAHNHSGSTPRHGSQALIIPGVGNKGGAPNTFGSSGASTDSSGDRRVSVSTVTGMDADGHDQDIDASESMTLFSQMMGLRVTKSQNVVSASQGRAQDVTDRALKLPVVTVLTCAVPTPGPGGTADEALSREVTTRLAAAHSIEVACQSTTKAEVAKTIAQRMRRRNTGKTRNNSVADDVQRQQQPQQHEWTLFNVANLPGNKHELILCSAEVMSIGDLAAFGSFVAHLERKSTEGGAGKKNPRATTRRNFVSRMHKVESGRLLRLAQCCVIYEDVIMKLLLRGERYASILSSCLTSMPLTDRALDSVVDSFARLGPQAICDRLNGPKKTDHEYSFVFDTSCLEHGFVLVGINATYVETSFSYDTMLVDLFVHASAKTDTLSVEQAARKATLFGTGDVSDFLEFVCDGEDSEVFDHFFQ